MQTREAVEGLHNFWEFYQPPECLDEAIQTRKKSSIAFIKIFLKSTRESNKPQPCLHTLIKTNLSTNESA